MNLWCIVVRIPRILIASPQSGSGKTTVAVGLMAAFTKKGLRVQPFKVGPDFIDPTYHTTATKVYSRNLDTWLTSPRVVLETFLRNTRNCDLAIVEGAMGLFDGVTPYDNSGSAADIGKILNAPIILVVDVSKMGRSAAALVHGYKTFDHALNVKGVILNNVGSQKHLDLTKQAIEKETGVQVVGALPHKADISIPERHLGLIPALEEDSFTNFPIKLGAFLEEHVDLRQIVDIARDAGELEIEENGSWLGKKRSIAKIGIAYDNVFNFYYRDNIELLEANGAQVIPFSPLHDSSPPENLNGIYLGGGFPEVLADQLEQNQSMRRAIRKAVDDEMPIYAECGGLIYLTESITDLMGCTHPMVGVLKGKTVMKKRLESLNYTLARVIHGNLLSNVGSTIHGHEFHYSKIENVPSDTKFAYEMEIGKGISDKRDGWIQNNLLASYMHVHFGYDPQTVQNFISSCEEYERT
jgi:cobyrinic acid a,c-diamide synthase